MPNYICATCGVQHAETESEPEKCLICSEERQYINPNGQQWTTLEKLRESHHNRFYELEPGLTAIVSEPKFAIGQRVLMIEGADGNFLWDCISLMDDATVAEIQKRGGARAIAISHPHFYDSMVEWSRALGDIPIYLHAADREWVMRPDKAIQFWEGDTLRLSDSVTLIHCGGHFAGSTALHWSNGGMGKGALLTADTIMPVADAPHVTFMYSYPNSIPMGAAAVRGIVDAVEPFAFDRIYGGWADKVILQDAKTGVRRSAERYIRMISG